jgi:hypothetical protein
VEKRRGQGFLAKWPSPSSRTEQRQGRGLTAWPVRSAPVIVGAPGSAAAGGRGETERRSQATYSGAHLGRGRLVEVAPRQGTADGGGWRRRRKWWRWWSKGAFLGLDDGVGDDEET